MLSGGFCTDNNNYSSDKITVGDAGTDIDPFTNGLYHSEKKRKRSRRKKSPKSRRSRKKKRKAKSPDGIVFDDVPSVLSDPDNADLKLDRENLRLLKIAWNSWEDSLETYHNPAIPNPTFVFDSTQSIGFFIDVETWKTVMNLSNVPNLILDKEIYQYYFALALHEISHYVICPFDKLTNARLLAAALKKSKPNIAPVIINIFADLIIDYKNYKKKPDIMKFELMQTYEMTRKVGITDKVQNHSFIWKLMMKCYEIMWGLQLGLPKEVFGDVEKIAKKVSNLLLKDFEDESTWYKKVQKLSNWIGKKIENDLDPNSEDRNPSKNKTEQGSPENLDIGVGNVVGDKNHDDNRDSSKEGNGSNKGRQLGTLEEMEKEGSEEEDKAGGEGKSEEEDKAEGRGKSEDEDKAGGEGKSEEEDKAKGRGKSEEEDKTGERGQTDDIQQQNSQDNTSNSSSKSDSKNNPNNTQETQPTDLKERWNQWTPNAPGIDQYDQKNLEEIIPKDVQIALGNPFEIKASNKDDESKRHDNNSSYSRSSYNPKDEAENQKTAEILAGELSLNDFANVNRIMQLVPPSDLHRSYYRGRSKNLIEIKITEKRPSGSIPVGIETWRIGDPLERLDILQSLMVSPIVIPNMTTRKWIYKEGPGIDIDLQIPDLLLVIDSSGSMQWDPYSKSKDPKNPYHLALLASFAALNYALSKGANIAAINFSEYFIEQTWTRERRKIEDVLLHYMGNGTILPTKNMLKMVSLAERPCLVIVITDFGIYNWKKSNKVMKQILSMGHKIVGFFIDSAIDGDLNEQFKSLADMGARFYPISDPESLIGLIIEEVKDTYG